MSTLCEVSFEPLQCDGSNYYSWSAHVHSALRTLGPSYEQVVERSILPKDFDNLSKLSNEEKECWFCNICVTNLLFENMDKELSDLIHKEDKLQVTRVMLIIFGSSLKLYVKKIVTMRTKKKRRSH